MTGPVIEIRESTGRYAKSIPPNKPAQGRHGVQEIFIKIARGEKEEI
ncbi:MAG TPA: hypothetical protein VGR78_16915 [Verrucomicrobiae bacterium]|jgi:hypothetical protein|nr:hypothetical protein [Verrucomicrobiae bacterium]